MTVCLCCN